MLESVGRRRAIEWPPTPTILILAGVITEIGVPVGSFLRAVAVFLHLTNLL